MTDTKTNEQDEKTVEAEFFAAGESTEPKQEERPLSNAESLVKEFAEKSISESDEIYARSEHSKKEIKDKNLKAVDFDKLLGKYDDIQKQSKKCSEEITDKILISDLSKNSTKLLDEQVLTLNKMHKDKSVAEKLLGWVPEGKVHDKLGGVLQVAKKQVQRNQTVKEFATSYFDDLEKKQATLNQNRIAISSVYSKLEEHSGILGEILEEAVGGLKHMSETNTLDKRSEINGKQLVARVTKQISSQQEIMKESQIFEGLAGIVSDKIEATLPQIREQFVDQVAITQSLESLKDLMDSTSNAETLMSDLKTEGLNDMKKILTACQKDGLGETKELREARDKHTRLQDELQDMQESIQSNYIADLDADIKNGTARMLKSKKDLGRNTEKYQTAQVSETK